MQLHCTPTKQKLCKIHIIIIEQRIINKLLRKIILLNRWISDLEYLLKYFNP